MLALALLSALVLLAIGWMLHVNAQDRKVLEKELERDFRGDGSA